MSQIHTIPASLKLSAAQAKNMHELCKHLKPAQYKALLKAVENSSWNIKTVLGSKPAALTAETAQRLCRYLENHQQVEAALKHITKKTKQYQSAIMKQLVKGQPLEHGHRSKHVQKFVSVLSELSQVAADLEKHAKH